MARFLAGAAACFLLPTGAFLFWQSTASSNSPLPAAPAPRTTGASFFSAAQSLQATEGEVRKLRAEALLARGQGWLVTIEYAATAPPQLKKSRCAC